MNLIYPFLQLGTRDFCFCSVSSRHCSKTAGKHTNIIQTSYSLYYIYGYIQTAEQKSHCPRVIKKTLKRHVDFSEKHSICKSKLRNLIYPFLQLGSNHKITRFLSINVCHWDFVSAGKVHTIVQNSRENIRQPYKRQILYIIFMVIIKQQNKTFTIHGCTWTFLKNILFVIQNSWI